jgi:hypothetical protein
MPDHTQTVLIRQKVICSSNFKTGSSFVMPAEATASSKPAKPPHQESVGHRLDYEQYLLDGFIVLYIFLQKWWSFERKLYPEAEAAKPSAH